MDFKEYERRLKEAMPHGPDDPCTCEGCWDCPGEKVGCTCDIDWDAARELQEVEITGGSKAPNWKGNND